MPLTGKMKGGYDFFTGLTEMVEFLTGLFCFPDNEFYALFSSEVTDFFGNLEYAIGAGPYYQNYRVLGYDFFYICRVEGVAFFAPPTRVHVIRVDNHIRAIG